MISLYDAVIPTFAQILHSTHGLVERAGAFARDRGMTETDILAARLTDDMRPLAFQFQAVIAHSSGAINNARSGQAGPDRSDFPTSLAGVAEKLSGAIAAIDGVSRAEVDALQGRPVAYMLSERTLNFVAEDYLLSFAQPNFFFHATTAYAILRHLGAPIGKRDYLGQTRMSG